MKRILVADDSVTIQKVIALTFAEEPFEVQSVGTGAEALKLVKSWKPDIVLADVIMPQMNGYELCRAVKQHEETSSVPVLLLAGTFEAFDEDEAKSVGADEFITKPFESGELIEKVKTLIGDMPATSPAEAAPAAGGVDMVDDPGSLPEVVSQPVPEVPVPPPASEVSEPDIWDILSDAGGDAQEQVTEGGPAPGFGPIENAGVVDVGSFDVALGRPESPPPAIQPPSTASPESVQMPGALEDAPVPQAQQAPAAPPAVDQMQDIEERSRVENMEKDFFGFETGAVEEIPITDFLDDAVEEVTFEMEQPQTVPEVDAQEVSFVIPEPAVDPGVVTGETISPDLMAPEASPVSFSSEDTLSAEAVVDMAEDMPGTVPVPSAPIHASGGLEGDRPDGVIEVPGFESEPAPASDSPPEPSEDITAQPIPEPPLELPVDLTSELPEEFSPEPSAPPITEIPPGPSPEPVMDVPVVPVPEPSTVAPTQASADIPDDAAIRKMVEERVEKIAWEVVPEMAEVIIREAIKKIKDGS